ncbi:MAG: hypothetical protein HUU41_13045 [Bryobacteraceae bacterium]|nr:hypothetical protein [Bryobacteraceae bacterium]
MSGWEDAIRRLRNANERLEGVCEPASCLSTLKERGEAVGELLALAAKDGVDGEVWRGELEREYAKGEEYLHQCTGWRDDLRRKLQEQYSLDLLSKTLRPQQRGTLVHRLS